MVFLRIVLRVGLLILRIFLLLTVLLFVLIIPLIALLVLLILLVFQLFLRIDIAFLGFQVPRIEQKRLFEGLNRSLPVLLLKGNVTPVEMPPVGVFGIRKLGLNPFQSLCRIIVILLKIQGGCQIVGRNERGRIFDQTLPEVDFSFVVIAVAEHTVAGAHLLLVLLRRKRKNEQK